MTAEVLKFPHRRSDVIKSLLKTAKRLEDSSPETCIAIQGQVIAMMSEEVAQSRRTADADSPFDFLVRPNALEINQPA